MVLKTELCRFSGAKIYPGKGIRFIRSDSQVFLFANSKCKRYFHNKLKPAKLTWTAVYRKQHKKDIAQEAVKKRRRATKKPYSRSIIGATLEVIQKRRTEKPEVRDAAREAALREIKERIKKTKDEKKAKKAEVTAKSQKTQGKGNVPKGAAPKGPKMGGGGGKRLSIRVIMTYCAMPTKDDIGFFSPSIRWREIGYCNREFQDEQSSVTEQKGNMCHPLPDGSVSL
ncbi:Large ribosomal subunit protein eL24-like protein [Drosera capensis]